MTPWNDEPEIAKLITDCQDLGYFHNERVFLVWAPHAVEFVKRCKQRNIAILGFDCFRIRGRFREDRMDMMVDLSWVYSEPGNFPDVVNDTCKWAHKFANELVDERENEPLDYFALEFVLKYEDKWLAIRKDSHPDQ